MRRKGLLKESSRAALRVKKFSYSERFRATYVRLLFPRFRIRPKIVDRLDFVFRSRVVDRHNAIDYLSNRAKHAQVRGSRKF